jgi:hypothetical protein
VIITINNQEGFISAYICFNVVNDDSVMDNSGNNLFISGIWRHESLKGKFRTILDLLIQELFLHPTTQKVEYVYWERDRGKILRFPASKFIKRLYYGKLIIGEINESRQTDN